MQKLPKMNDLTMDRDFDRQVKMDITERVTNKLGKNIKYKLRPFRKLIGTQKRPARVKIPNRDFSVMFI
ncbi:hypothetical protein OAU26_08805 [Mariniblastus sp.]|nr:hypothetical protein [Mariniblastus sp.]